MTYVLFPTKLEAEPFIGLLEDVKQVTAGLRPAVTGRLHGADVTVVVSGVGQANTAQSIAALMSEGPAGLVMLCGCAGAYPGGGLSVGDVAVASEEVYADMGVLTRGDWQDLEDINLPLLEKEGRAYCSRFPLQDDYVQMAISASLAPGMPSVRSGVFLTVCPVTGTASRGEELYRRFGALCENMEGAAAAQIAMLYGVPFIELRGISNMAGERDRSCWDIPLASSNCAKVAAGFIDEYMKVGG